KFMNLYIAIPALVVAILAFCVNVINAIGKDHIHKRQLLGRGAFLLLYAVFFFFLGGLSFWVRPNHDGNLDIKSGPANEAKGEETANGNIAPESDLQIKYLTFPKPHDIYESLDVDHPVQRAEQQTAYVGMHVRWKLNFFSARPFANGKTFLTFIENGRIGP